jgi:hypothetical protein
MLYKEWMNDSKSGHKINYKKESSPAWFSYQNISIMYTSGVRSREWLLHFLSAGYSGKIAECIV